LRSFSRALRVATSSSLGSFWDGTTERARSRSPLCTRKNGRVEESAEEILTRLKRYVEEESPEEVLTRLERYVASLRGGPPVSVVDRAAPPSVVNKPAPKPKPAVDTFIPSWTEPARHRPRFISEVAPAVLAVSVCAFVIIVFEVLDPFVAMVVAAALALVGVIGIVQRVPLARAWIIGLVIAGLLIRFS
jgi:hypothetical protein